MHMETAHCDLKVPLQHPVCTARKRMRNLWAISNKLAQRGRVCQMAASRWGIPQNSASIAVLNSLNTCHIRCIVNDLLRAITTSSAEGSGTYMSSSKGSSGMTVVPQPAHTFGRGVRTLLYIYIQYYSSCASEYVYSLVDIVNRHWVDDTWYDSLKIRQLEQWTVSFCTQCHAHPFEGISGLCIAQVKCVARHERSNFVRCKSVEQSEIVLIEHRIHGVRTMSNRSSLCPINTKTAAAIVSECVRILDERI